MPPGDSCHCLGTPQDRTPRGNTCAITASNRRAACRRQHDLARLVKAHPKCREVARELLELAAFRQLAVDSGHEDRDGQVIAQPEFVLPLLVEAGDAFAQLLVLRLVVAFDLGPQLAHGRLVFPEGVSELGDGGKHQWVEHYGPAAEFLQAVVVGLADDACRRCLRMMASISAPAASPSARAFCFTMR